MNEMLLEGVVNCLWNGALFFYSSKWTLCVYWRSLGKDTPWELWEMILETRKLLVSMKGMAQHTYHEANFIADALANTDTEIIFYTKQCLPKRVKGYLYLDSIHSTALRRCK